MDSYVKTQGFYSFHGYLGITLHFCHFTFRHKKMEYTSSLELQRYLRVGVVPLGNTQEDVVSSVQRQIASKEYEFE